MRKGKTYKVRFLIPGLHRKPRVMTGRYLGREADGYGSDAYLFDLRPEAGTQYVEKAFVLSITEAFGAKPSLPEIDREGARVQ